MHKSIFMDFLQTEIISREVEFCLNFPEDRIIINGRPEKTGWYYVCPGPGVVLMRYYEITPDHPLEMNISWQKDNFEKRFGERMNFKGPFTMSDFLRFVANRVESPETRLENVSRASRVIMHATYNPDTGFCRFCSANNDDEHSSDCPALHVVSAAQLIMDKAQESLGGNRTSIGTCKICQTPVYVDEGSLEDVEGNVWHMDCDGEVSE